MLQLGDAPRPVVLAGARVTVSGRFFVDGCNDNPGVATTGCGAHRVHSEPVAPLGDLTLSISQHGRTWRLGTADAGTAKDGRLGQVTWSVVLPARLEPRRAVLVADRAQRLRVVVRR